MQKPESTIATHTSKGLRRLCDELGGRDGRTSRRSLAPFLFLFQRPRGLTTHAALTGALTMLGSMKLLIAGGALAVLLFALHSLDSGHPRLAAGGSEVNAPPAEVTSALSSLPASSQVERVDATDKPAISTVLAHPEYSAPHFSPHSIRGRVMDLAGHSIPGVEVCRTASASQLISRESHREPTDCVTSDGLGEFEIEVGAPSSIRVRSARYATVYEARITLEAPEEVRLVIVALRVELGGRVVDERGSPVPNALVAVHPGSRLLELPGNLLATSDFKPPSVRTDARGAFFFEEMSDLSPAQIFVNAAGFSRTQLAFPAGGSSIIHVVLQRAKPSATTVTGRVASADGAPVPGAWVSAGSFAVQADGEGFFSLEVGSRGRWNRPDRDAEIVVFAVKEGYLPGRTTSPSIAEVEEVGERAPLLLELGGRPLTLAGRVIDGGGKPLRGLEVRVVDSTRFGLVPTSRADRTQERSLEQMAGGGLAWTDESGEFELFGLLDSEYRIEVLQRPSLLSTMSKKFPAGRKGIEIVLDQGLAGTISGRVIDKVGTAVAGVRVCVSRSWPGSLEIGAGATSDAEGFFRIEGATTEPAFLRLEGKGIVPQLFCDIPAEADIQELQLVVARLCWMQVDRGDLPPGLVELRIVDGAGEPLELVSMEGSSLSPHGSIWIGEGLSEVYAISDSATEAILWRGEDEVARYAIRPTAAEMLLLRL